MQKVNPLAIAGLLVLLFFSCTPRQTEEATTVQEEYYLPWESLGELFHNVQLAGVFPDSKTFVDSKPKRDPKAIAADYERQKDGVDFDLKAFVKANFEEPPVFSAAAFENEKFEDHLHSHWDYLARTPGDEPGISTLIPLPDQYVVPGGRFREIYYWDSYFTMIGLGVSGRTDLINSMLDNFAYLIDSIGFVPNGNRTYYLGRSQPPFFTSMVLLYMQLSSVQDAIEYLPAIQKEYDFWMKGADRLSENGQAINRVIRVADSVFLNRYWDNYATPRPESYREDYELAHDNDQRDSEQMYRDLRAGAESGWDYSTRWFSDKGDFATIRTTDILPVDLNTLLYNMERTLGTFYEVEGNESLAAEYLQKASIRRKAIQKLFWNNELNAYTDYIWKEAKLSDQLTMAGAYPLYFKIATSEQAAQQAKIIEKHFLQPGGLVTTTIPSGQQWDYPNGWAPLQWIGIKGLEHYGYYNLADEIAQRWLKTNRKVYRNTGKMMEKYNVADTTLEAGGGEYPTQDGFGWTNGVALGLMAEDAVY